MIETTTELENQPNGVDVQPPLSRLAILKLVSGEEIIAELYRDDANTKGWILHKPYTLMLIPQQQGMTIGLRPFFFSVPLDVQERVAMDWAHIMTMTEPPAELQKVYLQQRSGIQIVGGLGPH